MKVKHEGRVYWRDGERWVYEYTALTGCTMTIRELDANLVSLLNAKAAVANVAREEFGKTLRCTLWCAALMVVMWAASEIAEKHFARLGAAESRPR
jgi:hypothetical protein